MGSLSSASTIGRPHVQCGSAQMRMETVSASFPVKCTHLRKTRTSSKVVMKGGAPGSVISRASPLTNRTALSAKSARGMRGSAPLVAERGFSSSRTERRDLQVLAGRIDPKDTWWKGKLDLPNIHDVNSTSEFLDIMQSSGDALVIVDFYARWCGACRALLPKIEQIAEKHPEIIFVKIDYDANNAMCKQMGVRVLPFLQLYHGACGKVASFSCSISKIKRLRDAIEEHNTPRCFLSKNIPEIAELTAEKS